MDKVLASTMGMMTKKSHPFCIKPQLVDSSASQSLEDMNFDIDNESISYSQPCDSFLSPTKPVLMDTVDWANSQPVALKSLLSEARKISVKRSINYEPTWPTSDSFSSQVTSTSRAPVGVKSRPLRRTNSNARARLGPEAASTSSNPPPAPDGAFWGKDRLTVLVACQNVSERMDENAFALAAQAQRTESAPSKPPSKRKSKDPHLSSISRTKRSSISHSFLHEREDVNRWEKGKQRASLIPDAMSNYRRSTSAPMAARSLQRVASSSSSAELSTDFSLDSPDASMNIDTDLQDETPPTSLPPPLFPLKQPPQLRIPSRSTSTSSTDTSSPVPVTQPQIQLHPLLTQKPKPKQNLSSSTVKQPPLPPPPPLQGPLLSQSTRPPALRMRRAHTAPVTTTTTTHAIPTRQKAFKPPLLSQSVRPQPKTDITPVSAIDLGITSKLHPLERKPSPELELNADADSSFGDISLGVDDEELEMTMRQYD
ncbi:hypothetical protein C0992_008556 [Termitomyces sp. T32_za158]|nr:hypothetical protein C0992_008556 [Termitomyces sp. T32_za158]